MEYQSKLCHFKLDKKVREELNTSPDKISVVSTFDTDHQIVEVVEKHITISIA